MRLSKLLLVSIGGAIPLLAMGIGALVLLSWSRSLPSRAALTARLARGGYRVEDSKFFWPNPKRISFLGRDVLQYRYVKRGEPHVVNLMCDPQRPERVLAINSYVGFPAAGPEHYQFVRALMHDLSGIDFEDVKNTSSAGPFLFFRYSSWGQTTRWGLRLERYAVYIIDWPPRYEVTLRLRDW